MSSATSMWRWWWSRFFMRKEAGEQYAAPTLCRTRGVAVAGDQSRGPRGGRDGINGVETRRERDAKLPRSPRLVAHERRTMGVMRARQQERERRLLCQFVLLWPSLFLFVVSMSSLLACLRYCRLLPLLVSSTSEQVLILPPSRFSCRWGVELLSQKEGRLGVGQLAGQPLL